jgi:hypothetical protein
MAAKVKEDLASQLRKARADADAYLDARAAALKIDHPGIPTGVLRQTICRGNCPCSHALRILDEEDR